MRPVPRIDLADRLQSARARVADETGADVEEVAKFARMERKDALIRPDQLADLKVLSKSLMRKRAVKVERITDNTLIRIAIDLLFAHADQLTGSTEDALRDSVIPGFRYPRTPDLSNTGTSELPDSVTSAVPRFATAGLGARS